MANLHRGGPRVILGEGYKVYWGDIEDMQTLMYQEVYDRNIARIFGGSYGSMRSSYDMNRSLCTIGALNMESRTRVTARMGPNDCLLIPHNPGASHEIDALDGDIIIYDATGAGAYDAKHTLIRIETVLTVDTPVNSDGANEYYGATYIKTEWKDFDSQSTLYKDINTKIVTPNTINRRRRPDVSTLVGVTALQTGGSWAVVKGLVDALVPAGYTILGYFQKTHGSAFLTGGETWNSLPSVQIAPALGGVDGHPANTLHDGPILPWTVPPIPAEGIVFYDLTGTSRYNTSGAIIRYVGAYLQDANWHMVDNSIDWRHTLLWLLQGDYTYSANDIRPGQAVERHNVGGGGVVGLQFGTPAGASIPFMWNFGIGNETNYFILSDLAGANPLVYLAAGDGGVTLTEAGALYAQNIDHAASGDVFCNLVIMTVPALQLS